MLSKIIADSQTGGLNMSFIMCYNDASKMLTFDNKTKNMKL